MDHGHYGFGGRSGGVSVKAHPEGSERPGRIGRGRAELGGAFLLRRFARRIFRGHPQQILECLREMDIAKYPNEDSYLPAYTRTDLTDDIHQYLGFYTDYERMTDWRMRGNCRITKGTSKRKKN